ncbi:MAG: AMP-binding protein [Candidatus Lambdaproteobacteria bacterium]|nr:AMP-binding protein [Candidatus Lambdaproteobacteria bacterium]
MPHPPRFLVATPISHASGGFITPVFLLGGTVYLEAGFDSEGFMRAIERQRIDTAFLVPTMICTLLVHPQIRRIDLSGLETVLYAAAPMSPARIAEALDIFAQVFMQGYGQTESPCIFIVLRKQDHDTAHMARLGSCGRPVAGGCVKILDDQLYEAPTGEIGEICIRSPQVMDGYWKQPQETADAFRGGWLHTGYMARRDEEGCIYIVDRAKDMIISGAFNVFPREMEDVLAQHPAVSMSTAIGVPDEKWEEQVKAIVVLRPEARVTAEELIRLVCEKKGAVYTPKSVDFAESLPVTALGKADLKQLRTKYWQGEARQVH